MIIAEQVLHELIRQSKNQISIQEILTQVLKRNGIDTNNDYVIIKSVYFF